MRRYLFSFLGVSAVCIFCYNNHLLAPRITSISSERDSMQKQIESQRKSYYTERSYQPLYPIRMQTYENDVIDFQNFIAQHNYRSAHRPLIGIVTEDPSDLIFVNQLLTRIQKSVQNTELACLMADEVLAKVVAYRNLQVGQVLPLPVPDTEGALHIVIYKVDKVFDLSMGMPAFGLIPDNNRCAPILLFRGTDLSPTRQGCSSVLADLDLNGPGALVFESSKSQIHRWLSQVATKYTKARAIGYSLGGSFVQYTCISAPDLLSKEKIYPSIAFNQPGVFDEFLQQWKQMGISQRPMLKGYVTEGDMVSSVGQLIGDVQELTLDYPLEPIDAHVTLMMLQQRVYSYPLDISIKLN